MTFVVRGSNAATQPFDVTVDVGVGTNRKAIIHTLHRSSSAVAGWPTPFSSVTRDAAGAGQTGTFIAGASSEADNTSDGGVFNYQHVWYMDLTDGLSGNQTFTIDATSGFGVAVAEVLVYDDMPAGAPEASNSTLYTASANAGAKSSTVTGSVTSTTDGATLITLVQCYDRAGAVGPEGAFFTPDNGQTERGDATPGTNYAAGSGDLVLVTAGAQSLGWTLAGTVDVWMNGMLAIAPTGGGSNWSMMWRRRR